MRSPPSIHFQSMTNLNCEATVLRMMESLYTEDHAASPINPALFPQTLRVLIANPERGRVILFESDEVPDAATPSSAPRTIALYGYALLIPYWSNEFGGTLVFIDELFVRAESRGQGLATRFIEAIKRERPFDAVAIVLEVSEANHRARKLYQSLGFAPRSNAMMTCRVAPQAP